MFDKRAFYFHLSLTICLGFQYTIFNLIQIKHQMMLWNDTTRRQSFSSLLRWKNKSFLFSHFSFSFKVKLLRYSTSSGVWIFYSHKVFSVYVYLFSRNKIFNFHFLEMFKINLYVGPVHNPTLILNTHNPTCMFYSKNFHFSWTKPEKTRTYPNTNDTTTTHHWAFRYILFWFNVITSVRSKQDTGAHRQLSNLFVCTIYRVEKLLCNQPQF